MNSIKVWCNFLAHYGSKSLKINIEVGDLTFVCIYDGQSLIQLTSISS